jgi:hypothetical protein
MKEDAQTTEEKMDAKEELLNFDLDDLTSEDLDENFSEEDEEIIELVDLVEKGDEELGRGAQLKPSAEGRASDNQTELELKTDEIEEIQELAPDEEAPKEANVLDFSDLTLELNHVEAEERGARDVSREDEITEAELEDLLVEEPEETVRLELKGGERSKTARRDEEEEAAEPGLEGLLGEELEEEKEFEFEEAAQPEPEGLRPEGEGIARAEEEEAEIETPLEIEKREELQRTPDSLDEFPEMTAKEPAAEKPLASFQEIGGISEEQLEVVITRVVQDVVERVARETMANVAEKLITEAIEALKKSMESSPRG